MDVVIWTLAIAATWLLVGLVLVGCGFLVRLVLVSLVAREPTARPELSDLWLGLAVLVAYLQAWSLFARIDGLAWIVPLVLTAAAALAALRRPHRPSIRLQAPALALAGLATLWLANRALAPAEHYDLGFYHLGVVEYASSYPTVPGLGNLHDRLGAGISHLLVVSFLDVGPWAGAGVNLANGLLVAALLADACRRFAVRGTGSTPVSFTTRFAVLIVPATVVLVAWMPNERLSSPSLDVAAFVLVLVGALYLVEVVERGFRPAPAATSLAAFATAATTRPLFWLPTLLAAGIVLWASRRPQPAPRSVVRAAVAVAALPCALAVGWLTRQAILSGYPLLPLTLGELPVDWRMTHAAVEEANLWVRAWAREPYRHYEVVLGSWDWLGWWVRKRLTDEPDVIAPLALLAAVLPWLARGRATDPDRRRRLAPMLALLVPAVVTLVAWFLVAPDPRFAYGPIWIVPLALAAWALPPAPREARLSRLLVACAVAAGLAALGEHELSWFLPAAALAWLPVGLGALLLAPERAQAWLAHAAVTSVLLAGIWISASGGGSFELVRPYPGGALGTPPTPEPQLAAFETASGFRLWHPAPLDPERCWRVLLCTPRPNSALRMRGDDVSDGFTVRPAEAP
jgi:hypothetical protein